MPNYSNTIATTSTSGSWNGTSFDYSSVNLIDGIPHNAQLEIERVFTVTRDGTSINTYLNNTLFTPKDKASVFIIPSSRITFNETSKTITAISLPNQNGNGETVYNYDPVNAAVSDVQVPQIAVGQTIKVRRKSISNQKLVTWSSGTKLTSNQLNLEVNQLLYLIQEILDKLTNEYTTTVIVNNETVVGTVIDGAITPQKLSIGGPSWNSNGDVTITRNLVVDTNTLFVDGTNNRVGILNNSPTVALDVTGSIISSGTITSTGFTGPLTGTIQTPAQPNITSLGTLTSATVSGNLTVNTNTLFVNSTTNQVGIGTVTPNTQLHINAGASNVILQLTGASSGTTATDGLELSLTAAGGYLWNYENTPLTFGTNSTARMRILADGNVGIGTLTPSTKLEVNGSIKTNERFINDDFEFLKFPEDTNVGSSWYFDGGFVYLTTKKQIAICGYFPENYGFGYNPRAPHRQFSGKLSILPTPELLTNETIENIYVTAHNLYFLTSLGNLYSSGRNDYGQCGIGHTTNGWSGGVNSYAFNKVTFASGYKVIYFRTTTGSEHGIGYCFAILENTTNSSDKRLYSWGYNGHGQLGDGTTITRSSPVQITFANTPSKVFCYTDYGSNVSQTFLIDTNRKVYACGYNRERVFGYGTANTTYTTFAACNKTGNIQLEGDLIKIGSYNALTTVYCLDGNTLWVNGNNDRGECGQGNTTALTTFTSIPNLSVAEFNLCGYKGGSVIARTTTNLLRVWGRNDATNSHPMGSNGTTNITSPSTPASTTAGEIWSGNEAADWSSKTIKKVFATGSYNGTYSDPSNFFIIDSNDNLWGCGYNNYEYLATDTPTIEPLKFIKINTKFKFKQVFSYGRPILNFVMCFIGITTNNEMVTWGHNWSTNNTLPIPDPQSDIIETIQKVGLIK